MQPLTHTKHDGKTECCINDFHVTETEYQTERVKGRKHWIWIPIFTISEGSIHDSKDGAWWSRILHLSVGQEAEKKEYYCSMFPPLIQAPSPWDGTYILEESSLLSGSFLESSSQANPEDCFSSLRVSINPVKVIWPITRLNSTCSLILFL